MAYTGLLGVLVAIAITGCAYGDYFVVAPNKFTTEKDYVVQVSYTGPEAISAEAILGKTDGVPLSARTETLVNGQASIKLPIPATVPEGTYTLTVIGRNGGTEVFRNNSIVNTERENSLLLIQTDKPMYKPMQTVKMRIVCVDQDLKPRKLPTDVSIFDKNDNKLEEWLQKESDTGVLELSYLLSDLPPLGKYRIQAKTKFAMNTKEFSVEKYVLPKFEVTVKPTIAYVVTGETENLIIKVTAKYTYGKAVYGKAKSIFGEPRTGVFEKSFTMDGNKDGTHLQSFKVSELKRYKYNSGLKLTVNVTEDATMVTQSSNEITIPWYDEKIKMEYLPTSSILYRPGLPVDLKLKVTDIVAKRPAFAGSAVEFSVWTDKRQKWTANIDENGMVSTQFNVLSNYSIGGDLTFSAKLTSDNTVSTSRYVKAYRSKLKTMLMVNVPMKEQEIKSTGSFEIQITTSTTTAALKQVVYMVLARGMIVQGGQVPITGATMTQSIPANRMMTPHAEVFVYGIVSDGKTSEVIADSIGVKVSGVFDNKVTLEFSKKESLTGSMVDLTIKSAMDSRYYILAVDKSVTLLGTGNDLEQSQVFEGIDKFAFGKTPSYNDGPEPHGKMIMDGSFGPGGGSNDVPTSAGELLKNKGLVYFNGVYVEQAPPKPRFEIMDAMADGGIMFKGAESSGPNPPPAAKPEFAAVGRVRKFFPEAWLWKEGTVSASGSITFSEKVPDTITEWVATAFTVSGNKGLAITEESSTLRAFQKFFVSLSLPYSIKRGEIFTLRVSISNYIGSSTKVKVTLKQSDDFDIVEEVGGVMKHVSREIVTQVQVPPEVPTGISFKISPKKLGPVMLNVVAQPEISTGEKGDSLERVVLVKPEGMVVQEVESLTVEMSSEKPSFSRVVPINITQKVVDGSKRVEVKVTGDIMGPTVDGLQKLIQKPTGCGEQNMITLIPNIVVFIYLKTVNRLTNDIKEKAIQNMKTGYQRELQYLRKDGSYSAFGDSDKSGSTWLTAFVMKSFSQARGQITVDGKMMKNALKWLQKQQNADGSFNLVGTIHHQEMLGGSGAGKALTAFVYIALKESESFLSVTEQPAIQKAKDYLEKLVKNNQVTETYEMAIIAYGLTLAGSSYAKTLLDKLQGRPKPWDNPTPAPGPGPKPMPLDDEARMMIYPPPKASASDIEIWSYVLLAYAHKEDLANGRLIMKWLLTQQNSFGGFRSTQDTVMALQALAKYAALAYKAPQTDITLNVEAKTASGITAKHTFLVQKEKLLLLQSNVFPADTTSIKLDATGNGLAIVKVLWQYNTLEEAPKTSKKTIIGKVETKKINDLLYLVKPCFRSDDEKLGMSMMTVQLQSGFNVANEENLKTEGVKRVDISDGLISLYYDQPEKTFQCSNIHVEMDQTLGMSNIQPAAMETFSYYEPEIRSERLYTVVDSPTVDICTVCSGKACPSKCAVIGGSPVVRLDSMLLVACICLLLGLIVAM